MHGGGKRILRAKFDFGHLGQVVALDVRFEAFLGEDELVASLFVDNLGRIEGRTGGDFAPRDMIIDVEVERVRNRQKLRGWRPTTTPEKTTVFQLRK